MSSPTGMIQLDDFNFNRPFCRSVLVSKFCFLFPLFPHPRISPSAVVPHPSTFLAQSAELIKLQIFKSHSKLASSQDAQLHSLWINQKRFTSSRDHLRTLFWMSRGKIEKMVDFIIWNILIPLLKNRWNHCAIPIFGLICFAKFWPDISCLQVPQRKVTVGPLFWITAFLGAVF